MKTRILFVAATLLFAAGAHADAIVSDLATVQPKSASAPDVTVAHQATGKAAQKAAKRAAKAEKRAAKQAAKAAKRLAKQCSKERKLQARNGTPLSSACMPATTALADVKAASSDTGGAALGQTGTPTNQGTQENGVGFGVGFSAGSNSSSNNVVTSLPSAAYRPASQSEPVVVAMSTEPVKVPEPATLTLLGLGLLGLGAAGRRKRG